MIINPYRFAGPSATYSYWNPADKTADAVLSDSNKVVGGPANNTKWVRSVKSRNSGKWRVQFIDVAHVSTTGFGFATSGSLGSFLGGTSNGWGIWGNYGSDLRIYNSGGIVNSYVITIATNDVIDQLIDIDAGKVWWRKNFVTISGDPVAGTGAMATFAAGSTVFIAADPYAPNASTRLRTNPSEITGASVAGFTDGWPD